MQKIALQYGSAPGWVKLRELCGHDEESIQATDSETAVSLVDRLLVDSPGAAATAGGAASLTIPDRDRLLAAIYMANLGRRIESTVRCQYCGQPFDLDFSLEDLIASASEPTATAVTREPDGVYRMPDGRRFRLPCGEDERAVAGARRPELELLGRCVLEGSAADDPDALDEAMRAVGPVLDLDVDARCPECVKGQPVWFDLQHYLLSRLLDERRQRGIEIHRLARAYGWSLREILDLPRSRRRLLVELIERDTAAR
ncbi:hypothetical protein [Sorangium sp. So ce1097]|uniref:hypothetical protein n=1 Tax=Sorangium sp. So ce1097 TaxID=3133330 RepID=UPI003F63938A